VDELCDEDNVAFLEEEEYRRHLYKQALLLLQKDFPKNWQAFLAYAVEGRAAAEVAAEFGLTPGAVYAAVARIRTRLREELAGLLD
jgi:DNA-directed RNA polymerase specialized sigma24 family protein